MVWIKGDVTYSSRAQLHGLIAYLDFINVAPVGAESGENSSCRAKIKDCFD